MALNITLIGNIPSKKNSKRVYCRGKRPIVLSSEAHEKWEHDALKQLSYTGTPIGQVENCTITFFYATKHRKDLTNTAESVMDLLVKGGVIEDDNHGVIPELTLRFGGYEKGGRCEIKIVTD